jgi:hypothetical protein
MPGLPSRGLARTTDFLQPDPADCPTDGPEFCDYRHDETFVANCYFLSVSLTG